MQWMNVPPTFGTSGHICFTTLYNASLTMDNYYSALVNHDMNSERVKYRGQYYDYDSYEPGTTL